MRAEDAAKALAEAARMPRWEKSTTALSPAEVAEAAHRLVGETPQPDELVPCILGGSPPLTVRLIPATRPGCPRDCTCPDGAPHTPRNPCARRRLCLDHLVVEVETSEP